VRSDEAKGTYIKNMLKFSKVDGINLSRRQNLPHNNSNCRYGMPQRLENRPASRA